MDLRLIYALLLTIAPITELRVGLPLGIKYALDTGTPWLLVFILIVLVNILMIFFIFYFLDHLHKLFMKIKIYEKLFNKYLKKFQKKVDKFEAKYSTSEILGLMVFVAIPLPGTGAWTGCLLAWLLKLDRKKSLLGISLGVIIAGLLVLFASLGFFSLF